MPAEEYPCKICFAPKATVSNQGGLIAVKCPRCGQYFLFPPAETIRMTAEVKSRSHLLSGLLRTTWELTGKEFIVYGSMMQLWSKVLEASSAPIPHDTDITGKADAFLKYLRIKSDFPGAVIALQHDTDYPVAFCKNDSEFKFIINFMIQRKLIEKNPQQTSWTLMDVLVTPAGWEYLAGLGTEPIDQGFIAMSFHDDFKPIWKEGIEIGIADAGYKPFRVDQKDHINRIDDEIVAGIRKSRFVVADLSSQNAGAYFEAGFAMGLGKPVVWTCKEQEIVEKKVHFDTRQYSIVSWIPGQHPDFAHRLQLRIEAAIGHGSYKPT